MLSILIALATFTAVQAADLPTPKDILPDNAAPAKLDDNEPIQYFQRYKPSYFLLGEPNTKFQISFKVQVFRHAPIYFGFSELVIWDLFKDSAPFRDQNYNPDAFYRINLEHDKGEVRDLDLGFWEHESNGRDSDASRAWNRVYVRYTSNFLFPGKGIWWSGKVALPYSMSDPASKNLPRRRGILEFQFGFTDLFQKFFDVNELTLRIYGGGRSRINPLQGGQELTYREKGSKRAFLMPLYFQLFHGYGENLLDADEKRWGFRAGVGF